MTTPVHVADLSKIKFSSVVASAAVPAGYQHRLEDMTDDRLDTEIENLEEEVTAGVHLLASRAAMGILAKAERGRRTPREKTGPTPSLLGPPNKLTDEEKTAKAVKSEERIVSENLTDVEIVEIAVDGKGWNTVLKTARKRKKEKKDGGKKTTKNPATFSSPLFPVMDELLPNGLVLDPFAGEGGIHQLATDTRQTVGVEIEPEWAAKHPDTHVGNALKLDYRANTFDAICTSPTYGNRMADHHDATDDSERNTYKHRLGRDLDPENSGGMQWGDEYRTFHVKAWKEAKRVLKPGGVFILNISDHIRDGQHQDVAAWHVQALIELGFTLDAIRPVVTQRQRQGENADLRVPVEYVIRLI